MKSSRKQYTSCSSPRLVITDWDETVTIEDTIQYVSQVPYINNPNLTPLFNKFVDDYFNNYLNYSKKFGDRNSLNQEINFQNGILSIESKSIELIEKYEIFKNLTSSNFENQAYKIKLRSGFIEFVNKCNQLNIPIIILSANWTSLIINQVLLNHGIQVNQIITNELIFENGKTTGYWDKSNRIRISQDKLNVIKDKFDGDNIMYVGDSGTDLLPLLHVDIPCVIEDTKIIKIINNLKLQDKINIGTWHDFIEFINEE